MRARLSFSSMAVALLAICYSAYGQQASSDRQIDGILQSGRSLELGEPIKSGLGSITAGNCFGNDALNQLVNSSKEQLFTLLLKMKSQYEGASPLLHKYSYEKRYVVPFDRSLIEGINGAEKVDTKGGLLDLIADKADQSAQLAGKVVNGEEVVKNLDRILLNSVDMSRLMLIIVAPKKSS